MGDERFERELVNALRSLGWAAVRAPSSGSATADALPDVIALRSGDRPLAVEVKSTRDTTAYATMAEVDALETFAGIAGARPFVAARFKDQADGRVHYLVQPRDCRMTDGGNHGVPKSGAQERATLTVDASDPQPLKEPDG